VAATDERLARIKQLMQLIYFTPLHCFCIHFLLPVAHNWISANFILTFFTGPKSNFAWRMAWHLFHPIFHTTTEYCLCTSCIALQNLGWKSWFPCYYLIT